MVTVGVSPKGSNNLGVLVGLSGSSEKGKNFMRGVHPSADGYSNLQKNPRGVKTSKGGGEIQGRMD